MHAAVARVEGMKSLNELGRFGGRPPFYNEDAFFAVQEELQEISAQLKIGA